MFNLGQCLHFHRKKIYADARAVCNDNIYVVYDLNKNSVAGRGEQLEPVYAILSNDLIAIGRLYSYQPLLVCIHAVRAHFLCAITKTNGL